MQMQRREFSLTAVAAATVAVTGCGGGGSADVAASAAGASAAPLGAAKQPLRAPASPAIGVNLSGMEWAETGMRFGGGTAPNIHFTVPRKSDIAYLASQGYTKTRLPIKWEMLQPMLYDTNANAAAKAAIGQPGGFDINYGMSILDVLDAHAANGMKCIIDLHNYCRYRDFVYQADGSVIGLVKPSDPNVRPYTTDNAQVRTRIMSTAPGATLTAAHLGNFWATVAGFVKDHPGFGGYGLMNEPYWMPRPGETVEAYQGYGEDLTIWPTLAQQVINAIRAVDPANPIYLGGNDWSGMFTIGDNNPGFPLQGANIIYEVHGYLDAYSNGQSFDWATEIGKNYTAGIGTQPITTNTGMERLRIAVNWATAKGVPLAVTETGMPIDDPQWQTSYQTMVNYAHSNNVEVYNWLGGNHWLLHNHGINHVPNWYQNKTMEPAASGPLKAAAGINGAAIFDAGPGYALSGGSVTITVFARGNLTAPVQVSVQSSNGGSLSKAVLTLAAGANTSDSYTFTPAPNSVTTLTYTIMSGTGVTAPPARKVYALADPVAYAATSLPDAAMAILAKYNACKWDMADGYTDYLAGVPSGDTQFIRAVADSGFGSSVAGNSMEMINWVNTDRPETVNFTPPKMMNVGAMKIADFRAGNTFGLWCRKVVPQPGVQPNPINRMAYDLSDPHFVVAAVGVPGASNGVMFQASNSSGSQGAEIVFDNGKPVARWTDSANNKVTITAPNAIAAMSPAVVTMAAASTGQQLRVNGALAGSAATPMPAAAFDQMLIGSGFRNFYPEIGFGGFVKAVVTGKGAPTAQELSVLERFIGSLAGMSL